MIKMFDSVIRHRQLLMELVKREFSGRYRGSFGGVFWSFAEPLFMLSIYVVAFGFIMQARWSQTGDAKEYAFMIFAGLIVFQAFSECLNKAPRLIVGNPNFVKKVVFPLEILPWVMSIATLAHLLIAVVLWLAGYILLFGTPHPTLLYLPVVLIAFFPMLLAVGWLLAAVGVIVRDVDQVTGMLGRALLFMSPIFYSLDAAPALIKSALLVNPLTFIIEQFRLILFVGQSPNFAGLLIYFGVAMAASAGALFIFRRMRPIFADNL
jgi:lipopolysaccharide transport system permease protein